MPALKACQAFSRSEESVIPALRAPNLKSQRWKEGKELWIQRNLCSDRSQLVILIKNMLNPSFCLFQPSHPGSKLQFQCPHNLPNHPLLLHIKELFGAVSVWEQGTRHRVTLGTMTDPKDWNSNRSSPNVLLESHACPANMEFRGFWWLTESKRRKNPPAVAPLQLHLGTPCKGHPLP